ncbi:MAG: hypothetical protein DMF90_22415 [Acidobacteria bacterium]|nr:MAG: hypothetical protein DMF90_22415 [Acidobacteriota bacterium]
MRLHRWLAVALYLAAFAAVGYAQGDQARFAGTVRDSSGALVGGATVTVKNERTSEERSQVTTNTGTYLISNLKPSIYTIRAAKDGFTLLEYTNMTLAVGQELVLDLELRPAGVQESVTVTADIPVLDLSSARIGVNVSQREVDGLPVNGRQMSQLLLQAPGSQNAGDGTWQDIRFSGRANEQNVIKYDGIEGSAIIDASPGNVNGENRTPFRLQASLENVQEFRVESSSYPAEYGTGTGGQVTVITKSGSNAFHGSLFEYVRNDAFDARNHFDALRNLDDSVASVGPKSPLTLNQFGGSFGGRILKDRAFFFGSYEGYRLDAGRNIVEAVPSPTGLPRTQRRHCPGGLDEPGSRHRAAPGPAARSRERLQSPARWQVQRQVVGVWPRLPRSGHQRRATGRDRSHDPLHGPADQRRLQPPRVGRQHLHQRPEDWLQLRAEHVSGRRAGGLRKPPGQPGRDCRQHRHCGTVREQRARQPGTAGARQ